MRFIARTVSAWLMSMPGLYKGADSNALLAAAFADFSAAMRVKPEENFTLDDFTRALAAQGYKIETRTRHDTSVTFPILALPERSKGF